MSKLKGLLLTEGMHGMISQVEGLAKGLDIDFIHEKIELNNFWKIIPPKFTPVQDFVFKNEIKKNFDIVISCGRKSVIPSIYLKKKFKNKIINIHIQDPKVSLNNFDYIVAPEHDQLSGKNVLITKGAIHYLRSNELKENEDYLKTKLKRDKVVTLIVGGPNKYYNYDDKSINEVFKGIEENFLKKDYQLIFIPSMRTPQKIIDKAKDFFNGNQIIIDNVDKRAYLSSLQLADYIVVTCDSTSMISEAALTGKPIYVADIPAKKNDSRIKKFHKLFNQLDIIKKLDDKLETWHYENLDETSRIGKQIKKELI